MTVGLAKTIQHKQMLVLSLWTKMVSLNALQGYYIQVI